MIDLMKIAQGIVPMGQKSWAGRVQIQNRSVGNRTTGFPTGNNVSSSSCISSPELQLKITITIEIYVNFFRNLYSIYSGFQLRLYRDLCIILHTSQSQLH